MAQVVIVGGTGYGGSELLRILLFHPGVEVAAVTSREKAGESVASVHKNLRGLTRLAFSGDPVAASKGADVVFLSLPHGKAMEIVPKLDERARVVDLSGDFRLTDPREYERWYGAPHTASGLIDGFVYGLPEANRAAIRAARRVASPGCFATAVLLGLVPLAKAGLLEGPVVADCKTGSSGSGAVPGDGTHHPRRASAFLAYKPFTHQHVPEMMQALRAAGAKGVELTFQPHSAPLVRGIFASLYVRLPASAGDDAVRQAFERAYANEPFVRLVDGSPDVTWVKNTNFADIGFAREGRSLVVFVAIDNLVKGGAGQGVQSMNLMLGLEEKAGLVFAGSHP